MWLRSAVACPCRVFVHGLGCFYMIWSAATENTGACCRCLLLGDESVCWWVKLELVCKCLLLGDVRTGATGLLQVELTAVSSSYSILQGV